MSCRLKEIADASMQAAESLTPPQAATKIMAGMAEWRNGGTVGNGGNGGTADPANLCQLSLNYCHIRYYREFFFQI